MGVDCDVVPQFRQTIVFRRFTEQEQSLLAAALSPIPAVDDHITDMLLFLFVPVVGALSNEYFQLLVV